MELFSLFLNRSSAITQLPKAINHREHRERMQRKHLNNSVGWTSAAQSTLRSTITLPSNPEYRSNRHNVIQRAAQRRRLGGLHCAYPPYEIKQLP